MKFFNMMIALCVMALSAVGCATVKAYEAVPELQGDVLAKHSTVARYEGTTEIPCLFRTARCPDRCNHGGTFAKFTVVKYLDYVKPGKYGDAKQKEFLVRLGKKGTPDARLPAGLADTIRTLKTGQKVYLNWEHIYVRSANGSRWPERPVTRLAPVVE